MQLRYESLGDEQTVLVLGADPIVFGRDPECDVAIDNSKVSRHHCELRLWNHEYVLKDLGSQNGSHVNEQQVDVAQLQPGDEIRIGSTKFFFEERTPAATTSAFRKVEKEMEEGKGYKTILRRIVDDVKNEVPPAQE